eukprot:jgi/Chrzof1/3616/Cz13g02140.t1
MTTLETLALPLLADSDLSPLTSLMKLHNLVLDYNGMKDWELVQPTRGVLNPDKLLLQLQGLSTLSALRGLWLPDTVLAAGGGALMWQHMLHPHLPYLCIKMCDDDWVWSGSGPDLDFLDMGNPWE